jgi:hypothetical protein
MSTEAIFAKLTRLGIKVTVQGFRDDAGRRESAERLANQWLVRYPFRAQERYDEDFVWMAAIILWKRLLPDRIFFEQIDERMQNGYTLLEAGSVAEACDTWWHVWEWLKDKVSPERNTIDALDADFRGYQLVFNWCQDFEMELGNAALDDSAYGRMRIRFCQEFLETFASIEWPMRGGFLRAEAESYWRLGDVETAEARFEALIQENPAWPWGYIDWADLYWLYRDSPKDYAKGAAILKRALARRDLEERETVTERLRELQAEQKLTSRKGRRRQRDKSRKV